MRVRERLLQVVCAVRVVGGPLYSPWGRFPPSLYMETFITAGGSDQASCQNAPRWEVGQVCPTHGVDRPHLTASGHRPSLVHCPVGPLLWYVSAGGCLVGLLWHVGLFWICYAGRDLLWLRLRMLRVFFLFRTCAPENINSPKRYKYVSKRYGFPSLVSIVDGHILHLTTINNTSKLAFCASREKHGWCLLIRSCYLGTTECFLPWFWISRPLFLPLTLLLWGL